MLKSIISVSKVIVFAKYFLPKPAISSTTCAILGNGPSLKFSLENNEAFLSNTELFCVNLFATTPYFEQFRPQNYFVLDDAFANEKHALIPNCYKNMIEKTTWSMKLFVPVQFKKSGYVQKIFANHPHIQLVYYNYVISNGFTWLNHWLYNKGLAMPQSQNVLVGSLFTAIGLGYKKIYLFGADHTFHEQ